MEDKYRSALIKLVQKFEYNELDLLDAPKEAVQIYGYSCLSNSLMFKEPKIPSYNKEEISKYFKTHEFKTIDSLVNYIKGVEGDINKLFSIFCYLVYNVKYDEEQYISHKITHKSAEEVFQTKLAVCEGFSKFFIEIAKRVNINTKRIIIKEYENSAKGYGYNPLNPPSNPKIDHLSVYIQIDGVSFICEPTWAACHVNSNRKYVKQIRSDLFLIPLYKSLSDHYPTDEFNEIFGFKISYEDFIKSCKNNSAVDLKTESNPLQKFQCETGYCEQIYSCIQPIKSISIHLYKMVSNKFKEINSNGITNYEIIQQNLINHPDRVRFKTNIAFQEPGLYKVELYINYIESLTYFVDNKNKSSKSLPVSSSPFSYFKFIPIVPQNSFVKITSGIAIVRFAAAKVQINLHFYELEKDSFNFKSGLRLDNDDHIRTIRLEIPFDDERYEDFICITFPSDGRYALEVTIDYDHDYQTVAVYFFDVTGSKPKQKPINPIKFMYNGRKLAPFVTDYFFDNYKKLKGKISQDDIDELDDPTELEKRTINELKYIIKQDPDYVWSKLIQSDDYSFDDNNNNNDCDENNKEKQVVNKNSQNEKENTESSSKCCLLI